MNRHLPPAQSAGLPQSRRLQLTSGLRRAPYGVNAAAEQLTQTASRITAVQTALAETRTAQDSEARALAELERLKADLDAGVSGAEQTIAGFAAEIARLTDELTHVRAAKHGRDTTARLLSEQLARQTGQTRTDRGRTGPSGKGGTESQRGNP